MKKDNDTKKTALPASTKSTGSVLVTVSKDDLRAVCLEIIEGAIEANNGDYGKEDYYCTCCGNDDYKHRTPSGQIQHQSDCAYLIALDLSTGL